LSRNLGLSSQTLSAWGGAAGRLGGSAEGLAGSFQSFSNSIQELKTTGNTGILPWLYRLQAAGGRQIDLNKSLDQSFLDIGHNIHAIAQRDPQLAYFYGKQLGLDAGTVNLLNQSDEALRKVIEDSRKFAARPEDTQAAAKRQYEWSRLSQIFMSLGRTILTDLSPALVALTRLLERAAEWLNEIAQSNPGLVQGFAVLIALWSGAKILGAIRTLLALKNALLGIAEAETAVAVAGEGAAGKGLLGLLGRGALLSRLGLLGASAYALYETVKPQSLNEGENSGVWATGRDPTQRGAGGKWWNPERYGHAVDRLMKEAGLSRMGAQGLVARWMNVEAPGGPGSVNPKSGAFGIGQWLGGRQGGIAGNTDFDGQLSYAIRELNSSESRAGRALRSASTPDQAARGASMYERAEGYDPRSGTDAFTNAVANALRRLPPSSLPNVASGAAGSASFGRSANDNRVSNNSNAETHIGTVVVHTKATDAKGIAQDIKPALQRFPLTVNANYGPA
jgi:hypothetical protein